MKSFSPKQLQPLTQDLLHWYSQNKRSLPWRKNQNPYLVWLSEIILQQTRVQQGLPYFLKFSEAFPTVTDLANASEEMVLQLWQGLGYYSRGRNLHKCANVIANDFNGIFPNTYDALVKLPGIGPYTAAAIASICFNEPVAVVDGNVIRFITRLFAIDTDISSTSTQKEIKHFANLLVPKINPGDFNQAMMELGSLVCTPTNPSCHTCPAISFCASYKDGKQDQRPLKLKKTKVRPRYFNYIVQVNAKKQVTLKRRENPKDIWLNLYEFPLLESDSELETWNQVVTHSQKENALFHEPIPLKVHKLSHQHIYCKIWVFQKEFEDKATDKLLDWKSLDNLPKPQLMLKAMEKIEKILKRNSNF